MSEPTLKLQQTMRAKSDFKWLVTNRARLRWGLSGITLALFFGFVLILPVVPEVLGRDLPDIHFPIGFALALAMVVLMVAITGTYVFVSNCLFDPLSTKIAKNEARQ
ncbi:DUF485 domain-containing protein [Burkholderia sp. Ac-20353]|uniref:DUF485 domain-containing protein n=1 Tax=Burkholderia sp. Ac-20353 TaxID=2703894 RepID=UPI00197B62C2|nr:DUF485 domain-containing protein [Burkholderia sp. Ac-20353]MBN3785483.1 DUF485 domain-containing protein [Burkholderia sp. Ac-20353]